MKFITAFASLLSVAAAASEWSTWELYCGDSCDSTTLTASGTLTDNVVGSCTSLNATYDYCHLEIVQEYGSYAVALSDSSSGCDTGTVVDVGDCSAAGSWSDYQIYYYF